jgi:16S rRNA (guanine527-N7)-methyltransferase
VSAAVAPPAFAAAIEATFGANADRARRYAELLATDGVAHGLLGPREADRIWPRHLFNSAVLAELIASSATVIDLGSGAGLPGIPVALARPDLTVTLVEPMQRRVRFLQGVLAELDIAEVGIESGRAPQHVRGRAAVVIARAVAPLGGLVELAVPLLEPGGRLLALKGESVVAESEGLAGRRDLDVEVMTLQDAVGEPAHVAAVTVIEAPHRRSRSGRLPQKGVR